MNVIDLDGNISLWSLNKNTSKINTTNKSSLHNFAREVIKNKFNTISVLEEVTVRIRKNQVAYLDFFVPMVKICIEVHGEQHYKFTPFYHTNVLSFAKSKKRDADKKEWCKINNIVYVEFPYNAKDKWRDILDNY